MEFTKKFLRAKSPCADGFRWFSRHVEDGTGYQEALDTLVNAGRVEDACWLLGQFGPTNAVLEVDALEAEAIVFAGTVEVRGSIDVATVIRAGRSIRAGGGLRAGSAIVAGEDIRVAGSIISQGTLQAGGDVRADWGVEVQGDITCLGDLRGAWDVVCHGKLSLKGGAFVGQDLIVDGLVECGKGLRVGGHLTGPIACGPDRALWWAVPLPAWRTWRRAGASRPASAFTPRAPSRPAKACVRVKTSARGMAMACMPGSMCSRKPGIPAHRCGRRSGPRACAVACGWGPVL